jgi:hypothetical protein
MEGTMNRLLTVVLITLIGINAVYAWYQYQHALPQTTALDQDLQQLDTDIAATEADLTLYKGGLIRTLIEARLATLKTSHAMLDQKRRSLLRGIALSYTADGQSWKPASETELKEIQAAIKSQHNLVMDAEVKALTSGGLIGVLAKVEAEIARMTETMLQQRALAAKFGLPYAPAMAEEAKKQKEALGKVVSDPDGL